MSLTDRDHDLERVLAGRSIARHQRARRLLLAKLVRDKRDGAGDELMDDEDDGGDEEHRILKALIARGLLRRRRIRRLLIAHLIRARHEDDDAMDADDEDDEEGDEEGHRILRLLIARGVLRQRRVRRLLIAHLLGERHDAEMDDEDDDGEDIGEDGDDHRQIVRLLIASRLLRRRRFRNALLGRLLRERRDADDDDADGDDHRFARMIAGSRALGRRTLRRGLLAKLAREHEAA
jgi:hypothetical protein